jgi:sulfhydrogenase subunit alpha
VSRRTVVDTGPLSRVEGEGSLVIESDGAGAPDVRLNIFEPPRFFEGFLRGKSVEETVDIVSRICGICPVAYQVSALNAFEDLFGIELDEQVRRLRRILYLGEWIESHALHIYMLAAPDFMRVPDIVSMARKDPSLVHEVLTLKRLGNGLMSLIGGREVHPVALKVGGLYKAPTVEAMKSMAPEVDRLGSSIQGMVRFAASLDKPAMEREVTLVSLRDPERYAIDRGEIVSSRGLRIPPSVFEEHFKEHQVKYSNALQSLTADGTSYMVGPLARFNLNFHQLNPTAKGIAENLGLMPPVTDPFQSIVVRAIEVAHALEEVRGEIEAYSKPVHPSVPYEPREGTCFGVSEAPRGVLYHSYVVDGKGYVEKAKIIPPTAQNQARMEDDVRLLAPQILRSEADEARRLSEMAIRNYDPCISCATHFLRLEVRSVKRGPVGQ